VTVKTVTFMGVDISPDIVSYGSLEEIKEVLLAVSTMFTSENQMQVNNLSGRFSTDGPNSLIRGLEWYGQTITLALDGIPVYVGLVRNIELSTDGRVATITSEDVMKIPAQQPFTGTGKTANPGDVLLAIARSCLSDDFIDRASFHAAGAPARAAGATIGYSFLPTAGSVSCMAAMQLVSELCSISVFVSRAKLTAAVFQPYQGQESGLGPDLTDVDIRDVTQHGYDILSFFNQVTVVYPANLSWTDNAIDSQRTNRIVRGRTLGDLTTCFASDRISAIAFGKLALSRASQQKRIIGLTIGSKVDTVEMGDRFKINTQRFGTVMPAEAFQVLRNPDRDEATLKLAELIDPNIPPLFPVLNTPKIKFVPNNFTAAAQATGPILWIGQRDLAGTNAADLSGFNRNGVYGGSPTLHQSGIVVDLNTSMNVPPTPAPATVKYVTGPSNMRVTAGAWGRLTNAMTMACWIKVNGGAGDRFIAGPFTQNGFFNIGTVGWGFAISATHADVTLYGCTAIDASHSTFFAKDSGVTITDNVRHFLTMKYDGANFYLYVDGVLAATQAAAGVLTVAASTVPNIMMAMLDTTQRPWTDGFAEDLLLWDKVLSDTTIAGLWNAGK
jgi:hypothetical protein